MRKSTRLRFFLAGMVATSALAAFIAACGDDDSGTSITEPDSGRVETGASDTGASDTGNGDSSKADTGSDSGPTFFPGDATTLEAGPEYEGGVACVVGGQVEEEVNDEPDAANQLRANDAGCVGTGCSRCGVIFDSDPDAGADAGDGGLGGTELEYVTFSLQPTTKSFFLQFGGDVTLTVTVEDDAANNKYVINASSSPTLPFTLGKRYFIQVKSNTGARTPWRVTLFETQ